MTFLTDATRRDSLTRGRKRHSYWSKRFKFRVQFKYKTGIVTGILLPPLPQFPFHYWKCLVWNLTFYRFNSMVKMYMCIIVFFSSKTRLGLITIKLRVLVHDVIMTQNCVGVLPQNPTTWDPGFLKFKNGENMITLVGFLGQFLAWIAIRFQTGFYIKYDQVLFKK